MNLRAGPRLYCYIYIYGLKSLASINGLMRLLALQKTVSLNTGHYVLRCLQLSGCSPSSSSTVSELGFYYRQTTLHTCITKTDAFQYHARVSCSSMILVCVLVKFQAKLISVLLLYNIFCIYSYHYCYHYICDQRRLILYTSLEADKWSTYIAQILHKLS